MTKIIIISGDNDSGGKKGKKFKKKKSKDKKRKSKKEKVSDDIESPVKKEDWDFSEYGKRLTN